MKWNKPGNRVIVSSMGCVIVQLTSLEQSFFLLLSTAPKFEAVSRHCLYFNQSMFSDCSLVEDSIAAAWSKFTFTVLFNRSLASSDRFFGTETSLTENHVVEA